VFLDSHAAIGLYRRFSGCCLYDGFSNSNSDHVFARAFLILPRGTDTVRGNSTFEVNGVPVVFRVVVRTVHDFDVALSENRELERFPLSALCYLFAVLKYFER
jgi:hypothetical protein